MAVKKVKSQESRVLGSEEMKNIERVKSQES